jgi:hypothetical protein
MSSLTPAIPPPVNREQDRSYKFIFDSEMELFHAFSKVGKELIEFIKSNEPETRIFNIKDEIYGQSNDDREHKIVKKGRLAGDACSIICHPGTGAGNNG